MQFRDLARSAASTTVVVGGLAGAIGWISGYFATQSDMAAAQAKLMNLECRVFELDEALHARMEAEHAYLLYVNWKTSLLYRHEWVPITRFAHNINGVDINEMSEDQAREEMDKYRGQAFALSKLASEKAVLYTDDKCSTQ